MTLRNAIKQGLIFFGIIFLLFSSTSFKLFAEEIDWLEVSKINSELQFIDPNSIKYNSKGLLSVMTKYSEVNPDDKKIIDSDTYIMAIDCENRLYSKLHITADLNQVKNWETPFNNKLIKQTILNTCSY